MSVKFPFYKDAVFQLWMPIFEALSLEYFDIFAEALQFPLEPTKDLQQIAKDFTLLSLSAINLWIPEIPPQVPASVSNEEKSASTLAWDYTFSRLEATGQADTIYSWARKIHRNGLCFSRLESPSILMIHWALSPEKSGYTPLIFDEVAERIIQLMVLRHYTEHLQLKNRILRMEVCPFDEWDRFVLNTRGSANWLTIQLWLYCNIALWKEILSYLSEAQVKLLDEWQYKNIKATIPYEIPVSLFQMKALLLP